MFTELRRQSKKVGQPPGTFVYTGEEKIIAPRVMTVAYNNDQVEKVCTNNLDECLALAKDENKIWINIEGLQDVKLIEKLAQHYQIHPLTVEDILNVEQRSKVEEYENYIFITLRMLVWHENKKEFSTEQFSLLFGKNFLLSFQEGETEIFDNLRERLLSNLGQRMRGQSLDYLAYRLMDTIIDQYFVVLDGISDQIEEIEKIIMTAPKPQNTHTLYRLKRQILLLRKIIWPAREAVNHLLQINGDFLSTTTRLYLRDVYDHVVQAIDTVETFRDMTSGLLDVYLSSLSTRMNEVMKILTIFSTIFIPITFIASFYGMNFEFMPELHWRWAYPTTVVIMLMVAIIMLSFFRRKKWI